VCGACFSGLLSCGQTPSSTSRISSRIAIIAAMNRSISASGSLSVGSTIKVPGTGKLSVGAWSPKSISRFATSSAVMPLVSFSGRRSRMHSWATRPFSLV
jgi:hypothetical protein